MDLTLLSENKLFHCISPRSQSRLASNLQPNQRYPSILHETDAFMQSRCYSTVFSESDIQTVRIQQAWPWHISQRVDSSTQFISMAKKPRSLLPDRCLLLRTSLLWKIAPMRLNARKRCWRMTRCIVSRFPRELFAVSRHDNKRSRCCCLSQYARSRAVISKQRI